jgi:hypothetical protein
MTMANELLKAKHVGIRELKNRISRFFKSEKPLIVTERGIPTKVILSYEEMLELLDIIDELSDSTTVALIQEGRGAIEKGTKGIPVSYLFKKIRKSRR